MSMGNKVGVTMTDERKPLKASGYRRVVVVAALTAAVICGTFFVGAYYAKALLGGPVTSAFAFSGVLTGTSGPQTLTFAFRAGALICTVPVTGVTPNAITGAFQVSIPMDDCPARVLDDPASTVTVSVGAVEVIAAQPIAPVPFARFAERLGTSLCPIGYDRVASAGTTIVCVQGNDEVVRVGSGSSAFWIDRYEASVWSMPLGDGVQFGVAADDYPATFPDTGQWTTPVYAVSVRDVMPSAYATWFQMDAACRAAGKRLPTDAEWLAAARGTVDGSGCALALPRRNSNLGASCNSVWGNEDMIGNFWERTADWYATAVAIGSASPWPSSYGADATIGVSSTATLEGTQRDGMPTVPARGGDAGLMTGAGVFSISLLSPALTAGNVGFRCVVNR